MLHSIDNLREIARCCRDGGLLASDLASWLSESLESFLTQRSRSIEEAFGLTAPVGGVPWWREEQIRLRDRMLREMVEKYFAAQSISAQARQIRLATLRYAASTWRFERSFDRMPAHYRGTLHELLWRAFKSGAPLPIGERQLRTILATGKTASRCVSTFRPAVSMRQSNLLVGVDDSSTSGREGEKAPTRRDDASSFKAGRTVQATRP